MVPLLLPPEARARPTRRPRRPHSHTRARLLAIVAAEPGIRASELASRLGVRPHAVAYHAHRLAAAGAIAVRRRTGEARHYPADRRPASETDLERERALRHPVARALLETLSDGAPRTRASLVAAAVAGGAPERTAQWHLARLLERGLVAGTDGHVRLPQGVASPKSS